jgi:uncharacterized membrane protein YtjA (UPF0391 family)
MAARDNVLEWPLLCVEGVTSNGRVPAGKHSQEPVMDMLLSAGLMFLVIALVAYVLGATGVAGMSAGLGKMVLSIFLVLAVIILIIRFVHGAAT